MPRISKQAGTKHIRTAGRPTRFRSSTSSDSPARISMIIRAILRSSAEIPNMEPSIRSRHRVQQIPVRIKRQKSGKQGVQPKPQSLPRSRQCFLWECKKKCQKQTYGENCDSFFHIDLINIDVVVHLNQLYCAYGRFHNCRPSRCPRIRSCGAWFVPGWPSGDFHSKAPCGTLPVNSNQTVLSY